MLIAGGSDSRWFMDAANAIKIEQAKSGSFEVPDREHRCPDSEKEINRNLKEAK